MSLIWFGFYHCLSLFFDYWLLWFSMTTIVTFNINIWLHKWLIIYTSINLVDSFHFLIVWLLLLIIRTSLYSLMWWSRFDSGVCLCECAIYETLNAFDMAYSELLTHFTLIQSPTFRGDRVTATFVTLVYHSLAPLVAARLLPLIPLCAHYILSLWTIHFHLYVCVFLFSIVNRVLFSIIIITSAPLFSAIMYTHTHTHSHTCTWIRVTTLSVWICVCLWESQSETIHETSYDLVVPCIHIGRYHSSECKCAISHLKAATHKEIHKMALRHYQHLALIN